MAIDFVPAEDVRSGRGGKGANGVRYGKYADAIKPIVPHLKEQISKHNVIRVKTDDIAKEMGEEFLKRNKTSIYWGLKSALFREDIVVGNATHRDGSKLLVMRERKEGDVLPNSLEKSKNKKEMSADKAKDNEIDTTDISIEDMIGETGEE
jgi:hypothetical protein